MRAPRALLLLLTLPLARCSQGDPSGFTTTSATLTTTTSTSQSSFTGDPTAGTTDLTTAPSTSDASTSDAPTTSSSSTSASSGASSGSTGGSTGSGSTGSGSTGSGSTGGPPVCGDGLVEGDELCDDGNADEQDACLADCSAGQALLVLAGTGDAPGLFSRWIPGVGWSTGQAGVTLAEAALAPSPTGGALATVRRAGPVPQDKNELAFATWSAGQPDVLANFADVGNFGFGLDGPALATAGDAAVLAFLGTDNKHYSALYTGGAWAPFSPIPAGMVQIQAFGPSAAALAAGTVETYAVYAGDDGKLYLSLKSSPGGAWQASTQSPAPPVVNTLTPSALVDDMGDLLIAYVRKADSKIAVVKLITPQNAWTTETLVHAEALSDAELAFVRTDGGAYYLAWKASKAQSIRAVRGTAHDKWGVPFTVEDPQAATAAPALARGLLGAEAELLYPVGGQLHHARLAGDQAAELADVPDATKLVGRPAALRVQLAP